MAVSATPDLDDAAKDSRLVQAAVKRAQEGDREALHFLYVRYSADLIRYVNSFVHDYHESEDIIHNVFAKLITVIVKYEQTSVPFTAWILRVARNAALNRELGPWAPSPRQAHPAHESHPVGRGPDRRDPQPAGVIR